jgi:hypothetical protein
MTAAPKVVRLSPSTIHTGRGDACHPTATRLSPSTRVAIRVKASSVAITALAALAASLGATACGAASEPAGSFSKIGPSLKYRVEGGIGGLKPSLLVLGRARAMLRLGGCSLGFGLQRRLWSRLRAALRRADLRSISGDYPPPSGTADVVTYVVSSAGNEVRIALDPRYEKVQAQIEPLLAALGQVVARGERRLPARCSSNRVDDKGSVGGAL